MSNCLIETGMQLFARLNSRENLIGICPHLFTHDGPKHKEVIEIVGDSAVGKTLLLNELISTCILPKSFNGIEIGGRKLGAVIFNTDHHFSIFKLYEFMDLRLKNCTHLSKKFTNAEIKYLIREALKNIFILNCYDSITFFASIKNLSEIISQNNKISLLLFDSITSHYWETKICTVGDPFAKYILRALQVLARDFELVIVYTRSRIGKKEKFEDCCEVPTMGRINYRITMDKTNQCNKYNAEITLPSNKKVIREYYIRDILQWH